MALWLGLTLLSIGVHRRLQPDASLSSQSRCSVPHTTCPYPSFWNITIHRDNQSILFSQPVLLKKAKTLRSVTHSHTQRQRQRGKRERERHRQRQRQRFKRERERERETERENVLKPVKGCHYSVTVSHHQCFNGVYKNYNHLHQMTI